MMQPARMTMPMLPMVSPNPVFTDLTRSFSGMPAAIPNPNAATSSARKGCSFPFTVASTMNRTDTTSDTMRPIALPCPLPDTSATPRSGARRGGAAAAPIIAAQPAAFKRGVRTGARPGPKTRGAALTPAAAGP